MRLVLIAIACCAVLQPALAAGPDSAQPAPAMVQAALAATSAGAAAAEGPVVVASLKADGGPLDAARGKSPDGDEHHPTGTALLVAGLAIMTGIALRRRGSDQP